MSAEVVEVDLESVAGPADDTGEAVSVLVAGPAKCIDRAPQGAIALAGERPDLPVTSDGEYARARRRRSNEQRSGGCNADDQSPHGSLLCGVVRTEFNRKSIVAIGSAPSHRGLPQSIP